MILSKLSEYGSNELKFQKNGVFVWFFTQNSTESNKKSGTSVLELDAKESSGPIGFEDFTFSKHDWLRKERMA